MKIILAIACIIMGVSSLSMQERYPINFTQKRSIMTLMTQVEAQLKSGGPLDAITTTLANFKNEIVEEQVNHDRLWAEQQVECAGEFEFREQEVKAAVASLAEAQETLDGCSAQKNRADADLLITKKQLSSTRQRLASAIDARRRDAYNFETVSTIFTLQKQAGEEALVILEELSVGEASFAQMNAHTNKMLKGALKIRKAHYLSGVMSALAQLGNAEAVDADVVARIRTLIENYISKIEGNFAEEAAAESAAIEEFNNEKARLEDTIDHLINQQAGLEAEINALNKCIVVQSGLVTSSTIKRDRNQRIWDDAKELCDAVEQEYNTSKVAREEELELLAAITERVEARFAELSKGVTTRGETDKEDFKHANNYEYDNSGFKPSA